jgi:hypothetical protein
MPTTCFPTAAGVPGLSGAPNWYDNSGGAPRPFDDDTDDPRWRGAVAHSHGDGTIESISFRGLSFTEGGVKKLFLSWVVRVDPTGPADSQLYVGLGTGTADAAILVRIGIPTALATTAGTGYSTDVFIKPAGATAFNTTASAAADPAWIGSATRMWVNYTPSTTPTLDWAVQMLVPLTQELSPEATHSVVLPDGADFQMWYAAYLGLTPVGDVIEVTWPGTPGIAAGFPAIGDFVDVRAASSASDPACTTEGISLSSLNVGTRNVDGTARPSASQIKVDLTSVPPTADDPDEQNMFFAIPDFPASLPVGEREAVRAHFRLANWGSAIGDPTSESWTTLPGGDAVAFTAANGECRFIWPTPADLGPGTPSTALINDIRTGVKTAHQCILVELSSVHAGGATFVNNSVYRNMNFVSASKFSQEAEIALRLPGATSATPRDVFLYEKTFNMPAFIPPKERDDGDDDVVVGRQGIAEMASFAAARGKQVGVEQIARYAPTYTVQVYHDTGRSTSLFDGTERRVLRAQTSFGYFVQHEGALYGWNHSIDGAEPIGTNWYRLSVPENGAKTVRTTIEADETPGCLAALIILVRALLRRLGGS